MPPAEAALRDRSLPPGWFLAPIVTAIAALVLGEATEVDRIVTHFVFDAQSNVFPLRRNFWLDVVMHHWAKNAVVTLGCVIAGGLLLTFVLPRLRPQRRLLLFLVLALGLAPLSVTLAKASSSRHCPWDIDEFGGLVPYTRIFEAPSADVRPGRCFPAGHASTGFALMAFYFGAYARGRRRTARIALSIAIAAGIVLGMGRVLQGAHFVSHVAWAGLLCWIVMVGLYSAVLAARAMAPEVAGNSSAPLEE